jgi:hypothetical protein
MPPTKPAKRSPNECGKKLPISRMMTMTIEESEKLATDLWRKIIDGNMAYAKVTNRPTHSV